MFSRAHIEAYVEREKKRQTEKERKIFLLSTLTDLLLCPYAVQIHLHNTQILLSQ